jgi:hypothetical protein
MKSFDETERPLELLRKLEERLISYDGLIRESGGLAVAAYRVARARCLAGSITNRVPTLRELAAAVSEIRRNARTVGFAPDPAILASECELAGMTVITPLSRGAA